MLKRFWGPERKLLEGCHHTSFLPKERKIERKNNYCKPRKMHFDEEISIKKLAELKKISKRLFSLVDIFRGLYIFYRIRRGLLLVLSQINFSSFLPTHRL